MQRGYFPERSGQIVLLPKTPVYMGTAGGGWSHSGPWGYLQRVPLVFYGPGLVTEPGEVDRPVTIADVAPTLMTFLRATLRTDDGESLNEVVRIAPGLLRSEPPRLIVVSVWDGGGWNVLEQWPDAWPNLARVMTEGVSFRNATVGSSPSVTPSVHTTLGTGFFPWKHGISGIPVRDDDGEVVDSFLKGESSRFIQIETVAERWDEHNGNRSLVGMIGYEPWHLGMIGQGAEDETGDRDDAAWLDPETNEWITNPEHYRLPPSLLRTTGLQDDLARLDAADGESDEAWGQHAILDDADRIEETPAFITYHGRALMNLVEQGGYGADRVTDFLYTNFKQIDRLGHYFNMTSDEVRQALKETDQQLGSMIEALNETVGAGKWLLVVTADHGQQPDAADVGGYGIDPKEVLRDINDEFGDVARAVWPTEVFLEEEGLRAQDVTVAEVARFLGDHRLAENTQRPDMLVGGAGRLEPQDRLFQLAAPARLLTLGCGRR